MRILIALLFSFPLTVILSQQIKYENSVPGLLQETHIGRLTDFCVDDQTNYYLLDSEFKKIWIYNDKSEMKGEIPGQGDTDTFEQPAAIELTSDNNLVLLDSELKKVFILDKKGSKLNEFGNDRGVIGSFESPAGIALDPYDNIYVIDNSLQQIIKFNRDGLFRGNEPVINPIAITADIENGIYILTQNEDEESYLIVSMPYDLRSRREIRISNVIEPVDITVNQFGEFYVLDKEYRKVFHYGPAGNLIGEQIGIKSSSAGPGKFSEAAAVNNKFVNNEIDRLYVLDREFNYVQSFSIESRHERKKLYKKPLETDIYLENSITGKDFKKFWAVNDSYFFVTGDNAIDVENEGKAVFSIRHSQLNDIVSITKADENIYVADRSAKEIFVFSASDGSFRFKFGREDEIISPACITCDSRGNLYAADYNDNKIVIYSPSGEYRGKINTPGSSLLTAPSYLSIDENDNLYIVTSADRYIFKYGINDMKLSQLRFPFRNIENKNIPVVAAEGDIVLTCNSFDGVVTVFRDGIELARFLSKGSGKNQLENITGLFYDRKNGRIIAADNSSNIVKEFKLELASTQTLKILVNDFGNTELQWEGGNKSGESYKLFRKRSHDSEFQFFANVNEPSYTVYDNAGDIYDYAVKIVSANGEEGKLSNSVSDKFSYCKYIRNRRPEVAIDMLKQIKYLNETVIKNQIYAVYSDLLDTYKEKQKYNLALQTITRMKKLKPKNYVLYVDKAEIFERMHNFNEAEAELKTALDAFPDNINLYYHLLRVMQLGKKYDEVIEICNEGLSIFPGDENIIANLAEAYKNKENYPEARKYYRMLAQQYGREKYFLEEARVLIAEGKFNDAFEIYNYLKKSGAATAALYSEIAEAYILQGDYDSALEQLKKGLENNLENAHLHYLMGVVYSKQGKSDAALSSYEKAVGFDDTEEKYFIALAREYLNAGDKGNAAFNFEAAMLINPDNLDVLMELSDLYLEQEKYDYAYRLLSKAVSISPGSSDIKETFRLAAEKRKQANASREPIEFNYIEVGELTPALLDYYSRNPFGSVTVFNTRNNSFTDIIIEITCPELFGAPALVSIPLLRPNEFVEKYYSLNIEKELYDKLPKTMEDLTISFTVNYAINGQQKSLTQREKIIFYW